MKPADLDPHCFSSMILWIRVPTSSGNHGKPGKSPKKKFHAWKNHGWVCTKKSMWAYYVEYSIWAVALDFQQFGMCNQQRPRPACANAQSDQNLCLSFEYSMSVKLLTEHHLEFLSLTGCFTGSSESTLVKLPNCWKSHDFYFRISNRNKCSWTRSKESQRHKTGYWKEITGDRRRKIIFRKGNRSGNSWK